MNINVSKKNNQKISQIFAFFSEESFENHLTNIPKAHFSGKKNEVFVEIDKEYTTYYIGLGKSILSAELQSIASKFSFDYRNKIQASATQLLAKNCSETEITELIKGLYLGTYEYPFNEKHIFYDSNFHLFVENISQEKLIEINNQTKAICTGQFAAMDWLNKPANFKKTPQIVDFIHQITEKYGFTTTIFNRKQCLEKGLGAYLCVNAASAHDAAFTIIEYKGGDESAKTIGLVGKCVLFDTGGISIKPSDNMHYMKSDMGGATAVLGSLIAAAETKLPINIVAILPITDNAVSNNAYLPSDVIEAYNGKTIEVLNTDAEGRMTLADGLSYLSKNFKTDVLIDLATLTGSSVRMFGNTCGVLFSNNEELKNLLLNIGEQTHQRLWNMPLWDIWKEEITSEVADLKNISLKPYGDCIVAAKFLEQFIEGHSAWAHLDIAGVAFGNIFYSKEKAATGYGVQLLYEFFVNFS